MTEQRIDSSGEQGKEVPTELAGLIEATAQQYKVHPTKTTEGDPYTLIEASVDAVRIMIAEGKNIPELTGIVAGQTNFSPVQAFENRVVNIDLEEGTSWDDVFAQILVEIAWHETASAFPDLNEEDIRRLDAGEAGIEF